ncbi:hypothetical protein [Stakelama tenebrarum]|uniref:STAS/SEC14 domain-containing protein n=1 Tax=Stakelama tenebrarum TaxID=2711215 RepID=A0A6G6Y7F8_9SPHN|nr:hypothetical protein [Sphingosinithalassobacter tenebrarum]QIG80850.1 hypothetical protein G5C33_14330 [Sphingosinithalassobacter tenebrarum]
MTEPKEESGFTVTFEPECGILVCRLHGFLDEVVAARLSQELAMKIATVRKAGLPLLYLVDNCRGRVASPAAAKALGEKLSGSKRPGDRTAIVVPDSLCKLQAKRVATTDNAVFLSENAARTWLLAHVPSGGGVTPTPVPSATGA